MVFGEILRSRPRRRASHSVAEGFSPTASPIYRINFSKTIRRRDVAEATVRAVLIARVLQEDLATAGRTSLREDRQGPVRSGRVCRLSLDTLRQAVLGRWTRARRWACLPRLRRFLGSSPRRRVHQETDIREWV